MKLEKLVGERFKETPADCVIESHALMIRGGYMKPVGNGIYSSLLPLRRIVRKIEEIIREEMDGIDGQEVQFPVAMPAALWEQSGRYETVGKELLRFSDRNGAPMVLGMTHEEAAVHLVREYGSSYQRYPFMIYQIQTKFRDEARSRGGLIRVREFTMKDGYSFHTCQEDLEAYYNRCLGAYHRIFSRVGLPEVIDVASDSGMMGGSLSHEFMLLTPVGEDSIALCRHCDYRTNLEAAENITSPVQKEVSQCLSPAATPGVATIEELCSFFNLLPAQTCKSVVYQKQDTGELVLLFIRGDFEVNETKLRNFVGAELVPAALDAGSGLCPGFIGPVGLPKGCGTILFDRSLQNCNGLVCGGNRFETHCTGLDINRDLQVPAFHDFAKAVENGICPHCGHSAIQISRGIEVGNIFQLGTKYTKSMEMTYTDAQGQVGYPQMGCYGIGVGRLAASVCQARHDAYGPIWPMAIAPWQVHICAVRPDDAQVRRYADALYGSLQEKGIEVIYDDRSLSPGVQFSDADLLGVPLRAIVSPRNIKEGCCEILSRDKTLAQKTPLAQAAEVILQLVTERKG